MELIHRSVAGPGGCRRCSVESNTCSSTIGCGGHVGHPCLRRGARRSSAAGGRCCADRRDPGARGAEVCGRGAPGAPRRRLADNRGTAGQVALARRESHHRGKQHLGLARILDREMPCTMAAFRAGRITEDRATILARETACLSLDDRRSVDRAIAGDQEPWSPSATESWSRPRSRSWPTGSIPSRRGPAAEGGVRPAGDCASGAGCDDAPERASPGGPGSRRVRRPPPESRHVASCGRRSGSRPDHGRHPGRAGARHRLAGGDPGGRQPGDDRPCVVRGRRRPGAHRRHGPVPADLARELAPPETGGGCGGSTPSPSRASSWRWTSAGSSPSRWPC